MKGPKPIPAFRRIQNSSTPEPNSGCWLWLLSVTRKGYATIRMLDKTRQAHKVSYELKYGPVPLGLELDHKCRVRCCVNPDHLEPVTHNENLRRAVGMGSALKRINGSKTHCPAGHPYSGENLGEQPKYRYCRICHRKGQRIRRAEKRNADAIAAI